MILKARFWLGLTVCIGIQGLIFAQDFDTVQIKSVRAAGNVYMLTGYGGNIGVSVGDNGILLIDSQFGQLHDKIKVVIARLHAGSIRFVLNTNWHYDHALGNELFRREGAVIIAHENSRTRMKREQSHDVINSKTPSYPPAAWPEITFANSLCLHFNGDVIDVIHIPNAHSDADAVFHFKNAKVIHTGDLVFSGGYPYIDIGNGGSINGMIAAADKLMELIGEDYIVIPGHGPLLDYKGLQEYRGMLITVRDRVSRLLEEGKNLEETIAAKPTADLDSSWSEFMSPEQFVTLVYKDLTRR
jgi:glyoxylase-like metal-dependent hydrolase (beta-lactamase superfamily II)